MNNIPKIGVFLCQCGEKIKPLVDLPLLKSNLEHEPGVMCCEVLPYPCMKPGMNYIINKIKEKKLNRLVVAGCESRLMLKKFETMLEPEGLQKGQIDIVNLRGHVANVSDLTPELKAEKGLKLVRAAVAEMMAFMPSLHEKISINNPPVIVGGGIASFTAANEFARRGVSCLLSVPEKDSDTILKNIHKQFPGERDNYTRLKTIIEKVTNSPHVKFLPKGELCDLTGITGDYTLSFTVPEKKAVVKYSAGAIIACLDGELTPPDPEFGYDGKTVLCQTEFEKLVWGYEIPKGDIVFWINDYESGQPEFAQLSADSAWAMSKYILERSRSSRVVILYNEQMPISLSAAERAVGRRLGLTWIPYNKALQPVIQNKYISFGNVTDHLEYEIPWDKIILSPIRKISEKALNIAKILRITHSKNEFLGIHHVKVRPEMVGRESTYLAGSARYACNLNDALSQGRKAGKKNAEMLQKSMENKLYAPHSVYVVDTDKCVGCGQCQDLCDCGAIGTVEGSGGGLLRIVDPMVCTSGGTCAAACPYQALTLQNNTNEQREARIASLAKQLSGDEFAAFACLWGGLPAADNAGSQNMKYNPNIHILGIPCIGQVDTSVMARAFLEGAPGLLLIGCPPETCHHSFGVDHAWSRVNLMKKLFSLCGFDRQRIAIAHADLNKPKEFIHTVENFAKTIASLGGAIEKKPENQSLLRSIYRLVKYNSRIRLLLSSGLRRPWESIYRGDQRHALEYDRNDFTEALKEEFVKARLEETFIAEKRPFSITELTDVLSEDSMREQLDELVADGVISHTYKEGVPFYTLCN